jgi:putative ABC transport system substrate-binding protein
MFIATPTFMASSGVLPDCPAFAGSLLLWAGPFGRTGFVVRRRAFVSLLGGASAPWPDAALAQPAAAPVGFLSSRSANDSGAGVNAFRKSLNAAGYVEGQNVAIEYRWAEGKYERLPALAAELAKRGVKVLVSAGGEPAALASKAATSTIPVVFAVGGDPVKAGLVASFNRPGGNLTGISLLTTAPEAKRLGILHDLVPKASAVAALINPSYQESAAQAKELQESAGTLGLRLRLLHARNQEELDAAFRTFTQEKIEALLVSADPFFDTQRERIVGFATEARVPAIYQFREFPVAGGLMSYGVSLSDGYRWMGDYTARILKGAKPADLPIVQSIKFEFVVNLKAAKALGIEVPPLLLARADEVIE